MPEKALKSTYVVDAIKKKNLSSIESPISTCSMVTLLNIITTYSILKIIGVNKKRKTNL